MFSDASISDHFFAKVHGFPSRTGAGVYGYISIFSKILFIVCWFQIYFFVFKYIFVPYPKFFRFNKWNGKIHPFE